MTDDQGSAAPDTSPGVTWRVENHVAWATLTNPGKGNAISPAMRDGLREFWCEVRDNPDVRVSVLTGAGDRHFCTGIDVDRVAAQGDTGTGEDTYLSSIRLTARNFQIWKPYICAVNGMGVALLRQGVVGSGRQRATGIAGVDHAGRLDEQRVDFSAGGRAMLDAPRDDEELTRSERHVAIAHLDRELALGDEE
jgi:hypothetical protein